jgi:hypothetical protein
MALISSLKNKFNKENIGMTLYGILVAIICVVSIATVSKYKSAETETDGTLEMLMMSEAFIPSDDKSSYVSSV